MCVDDMKKSVDRISNCVRIMNWKISVLLDGVMVILVIERGQRALANRTIGG